jgi:GT2 family glycosyltransferase
MKEYQISGSIVTYNTNEKMLCKAIESFLAVELKTKLIIIDNSPTDKLKKFAKKYEIEYIHTAKNLGYGRAHNIAIRKFLNCSKYHLVFNADVYWESETIEKIYSFMNNNPDIGQLMPKVLYPTGEIQYLCKLLPKPSDLIFRRFLPETNFLRKQKEKFELRFTDYDKIMNIPYLSGCFMFFRMESLKKTGLFDERFFMYPEDIDITRRIHKYYKTLFYPEVYVYHDHAKESYKSKKMLWIHITNMVKYFNKWGWFLDKERDEFNRKVLQDLKNL